MPQPADADARRAALPVICYPTDTLPPPDAQVMAAEPGACLADVTVPPRDARCIAVPRGALLRIACTEGPQVGDLNLWAADDLAERFFAGKTRALHGTHLSTGDRLWSGLPHLRALATIVADTLDWYGIDADGAGVHDVIGTRCDPYTHALLTGAAYHRCCHSNLTRALAAYTGLPLAQAEPLVHDVLNVFMCTGFCREAGLYFMKASPVRPGDHLDLVAGTGLIAGLSACPGGDCGAGHSSDAAACFPLRMQVFATGLSLPDARVAGYDGSHGATRHDFPPRGS